MTHKLFKQIIKFICRRNNRHKIDWRFPFCCTFHCATIIGSSESDTGFTHNFCTFRTKNWVKHHIPNVYHFTSCGRKMWWKKESICIILLVFTHLTHISDCPAKRKIVAQYFQTIKSLDRWLLIIYYQIISKMTIPFVIVLFLYNTYHLIQFNV